MTSPADCRGDEVFYAVLEQRGTTLTGQFCEAYERDCYEIRDGVAVDDMVTLYYEFTDGLPPETFRVDVDAALASDGSSLSGTWFSSKCDCGGSLVLYRL